MATKYDPNIVADLAASLLHHRNIDAEPHQARKAVQVARMILDEVNAAANEASEPVAAPIAT